jgi:anaerobic magnesium-protoporphyrin IX monomethyl ester cyclase
LRPSEALGKEDVQPVSRVLFVYKFFNYMEPLGIMYLSSALKNAGHDTHFVDVGIDRDPLGEIRRFRPDIIAFSTTTGFHRYYADLNRDLKRQLPPYLALFGGPHPTYYPEYIEEEGIDAICQGEGELPMVDFAGAVGRGEDWTAIPNLWTKKDGTIRRNEMRPTIEDLDSIAFPDREMVYRYKTYRRLSTKYVLTARGCPFKCTYCFNHALEKMYEGKGAFIRRRSVANVMAELAEVQRLGTPERIFFVDDVFTLHKRWIREFAPVYAKECGLPFMCCTRINLVDETIARALREANVLTVVFAVETADEAFRNGILKREMTDDEMYRGVEHLRKHGIPFYTQSMVGLPGETIEDAFRTMRLNARFRPAYAWSSLFQPYPRTELGEYAADEGYFGGDPAQIPRFYYDGSPLRLERKNEIENLQKLFALAVRFPKLEPLWRLLVKAPRNKVYDVVWQAYRGFVYLFRLKWMSPRDAFLRN